MIRLVRHRGLAASGRRCNHLLFKIMPGEALELGCVCGERVRFTPADLRLLTALLGTGHGADSRLGGWEIVAERAS